MKRSITFTQKDIIEIIAEKAREMMPDQGGSLSVTSSISPPTDDRFTSSPGSFTVTATFDTDGGAR